MKMQQNSFAEQAPSHPWFTVLLFLGAVVVGTGIALAVLPSRLPTLSASLAGPEPKAYWYLSRSSAFVAYGLLWVSMVFGLLLSNKLSTVWPGGPTAYEVHQYTGLLGLGFSLFHGLILLGDHYLQLTVVQVLMPFSTVSYRPLWVGFGQLSLYLMALVGLSVYVRAWIGQRFWRLLHMLSFAVFVLVLAHVWGSSTSMVNPIAQGFYGATGLSVFILLVYRIRTALTSKGRG